MGNNELLVNGLRGIETITWTFDMKRLHALVGPTGCGKTT